MLQCYSLPINDLVSYDYTWTISHTAAILNSQNGLHFAFSNYGEVKQIYVNKIWQTYIVTRHNNRVVALYRVESIITEAFGGSCFKSIAKILNN